MLKNDIDQLNNQKKIIFNANHRLILNFLKLFLKKKVQINFHRTREYFRTT